MRRISPALALATAVFVVPGAAIASAWQYEPSIEMSAVYDDNYLLDAAGDEIEASGLALDARLPMTMETPRTRVEIEPAVYATLFNADVDLDSADPSLLVNVLNRGERYRFRFPVDYRRQFIARSELAGVTDDGDLGDPDGGDTGVVIQDRNWRNRLDLRPTFSYDLTDRTSLELGARYESTFFDEEVPGSYVDSDRAEARIGLGFSLTPTTRLQFAGFGSKYELRNGDDEANNYGVAGQWDNRFSDVARVYLRLGAQWTKRTGTVDGQPESTGYESGFLGGAGVQWSFQRTDLFVDLVNRLDPTSAGNLVERYDLRMNLDHRLTERVSAILGLRGISTSSDNTDVRDRDYVRGSVGLEWRPYRRWTVFGAYAYTWQEYQGEPDNQVSNNVTVGLRWEPQRRD